MIPSAQLPDSQTFSYGVYVLMEDLEKKLNYSFRRKELLQEALCHSSYANEHRAAHLSSNERLEFLGDSVLGFVTAEYLFSRHPTSRKAI